MIDPRKLCQIEIQVSDLGRSRTFYEKVFGWKAVPAELHDYLILDVPDDCPFGVSLVPQKNASTGSNNLVLYFAAEAPEDILALAAAHGGRPRFGPKHLLGYGDIYQLEDPDGQRFGLFRKTGS